MSVEAALERLRADPQFMRNVKAWEPLPARPAHYADFPDGLSPRILKALRRLDWTPLYTHQAATVEAALAGSHVVTVTSTASGKTLGYNIPVIDDLLADGEARALYLFPTKALAQDQAKALGDFLSALDAQDHIPVRTYDGDTPRSQRQRARAEARILISNPDMVHTGLLPHHPRWAEFLENLHWIVVDELHVYRGVFGSNVANLFRRLKRLTSFYGSSPRFLLTSATIANPRELAQRLVEAPVELVPADLDGSPRAEKHVILYNPPVIDPRLGIRRAYTLEATRIAERFLEEGVQTAVFARARLTTEVLLGYLRDSVQENGQDPGAIRGYRGGYLPLERRAIERGLREGDVRGVVATNALELGVDIGRLGVAVIAGYPGTISSLWQQAGRAGRRSDVSAAVVVASGAPLDQFVVTHPRYLFERPPELGLINPDNLAILLRHLRCAAFELPFRAGESFGGFGEVVELLDFLEEEGVLYRSGQDYHWVSDEYPAEAVSLRASTDDQVVVQRLDEGRPTVIGEVDRATAPILVHEGAIYIHEGDTFFVTELDWDGGVAAVTPQQVDYYTDATEAVDLEVLEPYDADETRIARRAHGWIEVTSRATSYRKVKRYTHETIGYGKIDLPERRYETSAYWVWIAPQSVEELEERGVLSPPIEYGPSWPQASKAARVRDGYRCRQCGSRERHGRAHDVHHLRPFREFGFIPGENRNDRIANDIDNLITLCPSCHRRAETARGARSALSGLRYALQNIAPLYLMCDPRDLGSQIEIRSKETRGPRITLYDRVPGGLGLSERLYELHGELLTGALELVRSCSCQDGCPACVGPPGSGDADVKRVTLQLLEELVESG